jgi:hypothetical protein
LIGRGAAFIRAEETSVAATASASTQYWIVGTIIAVVFLVILVVVLIYLMGRKKNERINKKDVAVGNSSPPLPQSESTSRASRSKASKFSKQIVSKLVSWCDMYQLRLSVD